MRSLSLILLAIVSSSGCLIADHHVSTELHKICTDSVPLPYSRESGNLFVAELDIDGVSRTVDVDAFASLSTLEIEPIGEPETMEFAESITIDILAPGSPLPDVRVAELPSPGPATPITGTGDQSINLVDYLVAEALVMRVEVRGQPPGGQDAFVASFQACLATDGLRVED